VGLAKVSPIFLTCHPKLQQQCFIVRDANGQALSRAGAVQQVFTMPSVIFP
jgi:hypothetical protein